MNKTTKGEGMVDVGAKAVTRRVAVAEASVRMSKKAFADLTGKGSPKGNVFETARTAGILAAKSTPQLIPFCHPLMLTKVNVRFDSDKRHSCVRVEAEVACLGQTGVEMEAMTAASVAALTVYDMMKWSDPAMVISDVRLLSKQGGKRSQP